jgi:hypothetical protein
MDNINDITRAIHFLSNEGKMPKEGRIDTKGA